MIGRTLLHYEITAELGAGMMGRVYAARDHHTGRRVALKVELPQAANPEGRARLRREAAAAAQLFHPGIVALFALEEADGEVFLVQELVEGETLAARIARGPLDPAEAWRLARELTAALAHAHARGVLHRDLKPANVLIARDGTFKIADFGLARLEGAPSLTDSGAVVGSLAYMAPERVRGEKGDARSDLFSLGAVLYEAMCGRRAFPGDSLEAVVYMVLNEAPSALRLSSALDRLAELAMRLLAKEPSRRPESAEHLARLLAATPAQPLPSRRWRARLLPMAAAAGLLLLAGWAAVRLLPHLLPEPSRSSGIAVLPFENMVDARDPSRLGMVVSSLLIASLAETESDSVVSTDRVLDILNDLGRVGDPVGRRYARAVAQRAHARRIVTGSILRVDSGLIVTAEVSEAASGRVVNAARVAGTPEQSVFDVADSLAVMIRRALAMGPTVAAEAGKRETSDPRAYQLYIAGLERLARGEAEPAIGAFSAALELDPGFEQASRQLAFARWLASTRTPRETQ